MQNCSSVANPQSPPASQPERAGSTQKEHACVARTVFPGTATAGTQIVRGVPEPGGAALFFFPRIDF